MWYRNTSFDVLIVTLARSARKYLESFSMSVLSAGDLHDQEYARHRASWGKKAPTPAEQLAAQEQRIAALRQQRMIEIYGDPAKNAAREFRNEQLTRELEKQSRLDQAAAPV